MRRETDRASGSLDAVVKDIFKLSDEDTWRIGEAIADLARALARDEIERKFNERKFNEGDYRG